MFWLLKISAVGETVSLRSSAKINACASLTLRRMGLKQFGEREK